MRVKEALKGTSVLVDSSDAVLFVFDVAQVKQSLRLFEWLMAYRLPVFVVFTFFDRLEKSR